SAGKPGDGDDHDQHNEECQSDHDDAFSKLRVHAHRTRNGPVGSLAGIQGSEGFAARTTEFLDRAISGDRSREDTINAPPYAYRPAGPSKSCSSTIFIIAWAILRPPWEDGSMGFA